MSGDHTYPALEKLKEEADGLDALIEIAPPWLEGLVEYAFEMDYVQRKQEILEQRDSTRKQYISGRKRIESTYGTVVNRSLKRRIDGETPSIGLDRLESDLTDAKRSIEELRTDLDEDYLTVPERRKLKTLEEEIFDAREYARTKRRFETYRDSIRDEIERFEERWEPYADRDRYLVTSDEEFLAEQSALVLRTLSDMARELKLHILPDDDSSWLSRNKSRFGGLVDAIPQYNEAFVERQRRAYADVLTSPHGPLNDSQQKAVIRNDKRNLVDASAGTGKTLTLTHRFMYLLEKGVPASRIVAITYMGDAADEMKARIAEESGLREEELQISTIHAFARRICMRAAETGTTDRDIGDKRTQLVKKYFWAAMYDETPDSNRHPELYRQFEEAFRAFRETDERKRYVEENSDFRTDWEAFVLEKLEEFLKNARTFELSASDVRRQLDESHAVAYEFGRAATYLLEAYERAVAEETTPTDFDDMIRTARRVVEDNPEQFAYGFDHVLVDEYQDVSESTLEFIDALADTGDDTRLFCVGDDWQSIMGFTGSNVRYFTEFEERYDDVTYTSLKINYRCPPRIVDAGSELIAQSDAKQNQKEVQADASPAEFDDRRTMQLHALRDLYEPRAATYAVERIERAIDEGYGYDEIMVLSRNDANSQYMSDLREELERRGVPHTRPDYREDYLPDAVRDSVAHEITHTNKGDAEFVNDSEADEELPLITVQSVHSSKGTEAPVVIFLHAVGDDPEGIPIEERTDALLQPSTDITSRHVPEERRLFYVALTRAEEQFQAITKAGSVTQFVRDIEDRFTRRSSTPEIVGECTEFDPPENGRQPYKAKLDCGTFDVRLLAWPNNDPPVLVEGETYRVSELEVDSDPDFGEEIRYDTSTIEKVS